MSQPPVLPLGKPAAAKAIRSASSLLDGIEIVPPPALSLYGTPSEPSFDVIDAASVADSPEDSTAYDGLVTHDMKNMPPTIATTSSSAASTNCAGVKALYAAVARFFIASISTAAISDLHPHDLLVGLDGLVPDCNRQLHIDAGFGHCGRHGRDIAVSGGDVRRGAVRRSEVIAHRVQA